MLVLLVVCLACALGATQGEYVVTFSDALPDWLLAELQQEAHAFDAFSGSRSVGLAHRKRGTYWLQLRNVTTGEWRQRKPRCYTELAIQWLWSYAQREVVGGVGRAPGVNGVIGAEWWYQVRGATEDIGFHYDKDEGLASVHSTMRHPILSTITYLGDNGSPTLILNQRTDGNINDPTIPEQSYLIYPLAGRHVIFDGRTQHGVVGSLSGSEQVRISLLVNWWDSPRPLKPYTTAVRNEDLKAMGLLNRAAVKDAFVGYGPGAGGVLEQPVGLHIGDAYSGDLMPVRIKVPPAEGIHFSLPKDIAPGVYNISWSDAHMSGGFSTLDLWDDIQVQAMFNFMEPKLLLFYGNDQDRENLLLDIVPRLARRYNDQVKVYLCGVDTCRDAFQVFGIDSNDGMPAAAIHQTHPVDRKYPCSRGLSEDSLIECIERYFATRVE